MEKNKKVEPKQDKVKKYKTITLIGSTKYPKVFEQAVRDLTLNGWIVLTVGVFGHQESMDMAGATKKMLDDMYLEKIRMSDAVMILNVKTDTHPKGYIGLGACDELFFALSEGEEIKFLHPIENWSEIVEDQKL